MVLIDAHDQSEDSLLRGWGVAGLPRACDALHPTAAPSPAAPKLQARPHEGPWPRSAGLRSEPALCRAQRRLPVDLASLAAL